MKILITNYTFDASSKTITFDEYIIIDLERILIITNTTKGIIIYNFADETKNGTVNNNILTLEYDTASMSDTDALQIFYEIDEDPTKTYKISDIDDNSNPRYYGFLKTDGSWYILKEDTVLKTYRYAKGESEYSEAWEDRTILGTYNYFNAIF